MDFQGRYLIAAPPAAVWAALHDPDILASCIPGCQGVTRTSDTEYQAIASIKIGPVKARFTGKVTWQDATPPQGFTHAGALSGEGQGGPAGFARGSSQVMLATEGVGTALTYTAKATIGGKLAQVGQRLIDSTAKSIADEFFSNFEALMHEGRQAVAQSEAKARKGAAPPRARRRRAPVEEGLKPQVWVVGLIAIVALLLVLFSIVL